MGMMPWLDEILPRAGYGIKGITDNQETVASFVKSKAYTCRKQMRNDWGMGSKVYAALMRTGKLHWLDDVLPARSQTEYNFENLEAFQKCIQDLGFKSQTSLTNDKEHGRKILIWVRQNDKQEWLDQVLPKKKLEKKADLTQEEIEEFIISNGYRSRTEMKLDHENGGASMVSWLYKYNKIHFLDRILPAHTASSKVYTKADIKKIVETYSIKDTRDFTKIREARVAYHWIKRHHRDDLLEGLVIIADRRCPVPKVRYTEAEIAAMIDQNGIKSRKEFSVHEQTRRIYSWLAYWKKLDVLDRYLPRYHVLEDKEKVA